ncbi:MAG: O-antigen ligase family protein [Acidobacteria bacterium]|nr:O-antigen ligase family protein [Acidobacteriota bacterium]
MIIHFGLDQHLGLILYCAGIAAFLLSIFWRPIVGVYYLVPLLPLQTTRYRMMDFPLGASVVTLVLAAVAIGLLRRRRWIFPKTPWTVVVACYGLLTFASLFLDSDYLVPRLREWSDFMMMPLLLFLVAATVDDVRQMRWILLLMCLAVFVMDKSFWDAIRDRDYSTFSRDLQEDGAMGYAGAQGMAAFNAQYAWFLVALAGTFSARIAKWTCLGLAVFAANCVMYSFSRGGYVAFLVGWVFVGVLRYRVLLVVFAVLATCWASIVPNAVRERVLMTYDPNQGELDHSAELRLELWDDALNLVRDNPAFGSGFNTYAYMKRLYGYGDTHNIYLKVLVETGVAGLAIFLWLLTRTFRTGYCLFRRSRTPLFSGLGLGLAAWVVCTAAANLFGDRWNYLQISGYLWVLAGLVSRALAIESAGETEESEAETAQTPYQAVPATAG